MSSLKRTNDSEASKNPKKKRPVTRQSHARMATTQEAEPASKEVIDPDGDLILVLPNAELQVSSKFLCMTSKVFKAMLSTRFAEGTADLVGGIRRINLPDDSTEATSILCGILHYRCTTASPDLATLEKVAMVTDKYDCVAAMSHWSHVALQNHLRDDIAYPEIGRLLYPTYAFDDPHAFGTLTRIMVYGVKGSADPLNGSFSNWVPLEIRDLVPYDIFGKAMFARYPLAIVRMSKTDWALKTVTLLMRQNDIKFDLQLDLERIIERSASKAVDYSERNIPRNDDECFSQCDSDRIGFFINALSMCGLSPMASAIRDQSIRSLCKRLENCNFDYFTTTSTYRYRCHECGPGMAEAVQSATKKVYKAFGGLCLDCVKQHKKNAQEWAKCRIPHTDFRGLEQDRDKTKTVGH